jgi:glyoxylase-like metal-dependent hydrolase (beta-lactamase superfamily II)
MRNRQGTGEAIMENVRAAVIPVTQFQQNCTLMWCAKTMRAVVVDPGGDLPRLRQAIAETKVTVERIWLTHGHIDHAGAAAELRQELGVPIEGPHRADEFWLNHIAASGLKFGMFGARNVVPDRWLDDGDEVVIGTLTFAVLHCPGHSAGSVAFFNAQERFAIVGDVLFSGSVGRSDLPGGDHATLLRSINDKLLPLGDDVAFICGHGPGSTIGRERASNPYLK